MDLVDSLTCRFSLKAKIDYYAAYRVSIREEEGQINSVGVFGGIIDPHCKMCVGVVAAPKRPHLACIQFCQQALQGTEDR